MRNNRVPKTRHRNEFVSIMKLTTTCRSMQNTGVFHYYRRFAAPVSLVVGATLAVLLFNSFSNIVDSYSLTRNTINTSSTLETTCVVVVAVAAI